MRASKPFTPFAPQEGYGAPTVYPTASLALFVNDGPGAGGSVPRPKDAPLRTGMFHT
ncbi:hypothetical protein [Sodalis praecaptivus]|uniref:hypothetical protein n=1 Tax=Sodalis praecaptivus TaxID=1239307 RepID=UPI0004B46110|nr:hypothetical protein [Sodalis praecaptivus]